MKDARPGRRAHCAVGGGPVARAAGYAPLRASVAMVRDAFGAFVAHFAGGGTALGSATFGAFLGRFWERIYLVATKSRVVAQRKLRGL